MWFSIKKQIIPLITGFVIGVNITLFFYYPIHNKTSLKNVEKDIEILADEMFNKIRVVCWVMTNPANHKTKAIHAKNTWGKRCNKLLFMSSEFDPELDSITLPISEGRTHLWDKTKAAFRYIHRNYLHTGDWFLKADDDAYVIMENLRYMLYQYNSETSLYFGHRFVISYSPYSYMAGGTYILSKKALIKLDKLLSDEKNCQPNADGNEDLELGKCLWNRTIFVDERDEFQQKRFFPVGLDEHLLVQRTPDYWYWYSMYYDVIKGRNSCCSKNIIAIHYVSPSFMYFLEYFVYHVRAFGRLKNNRKLPRKLTITEIISASDVDSNSSNYKRNPVNHLLENSELY